MRPELTRAIVGGWLVGLAWLTSQQVHVWSSERTLWTQAVHLAPLKPRPHINLGRALELAGDLEGAEREYLLTTSLSLDLQRPAREMLFARVVAETNLAHLRMKQGQAATAMRILDQVLTEWPGFPYAAYNRAVIFSAVGACGLAMESYAVTRAFPDLVFPGLPVCAEPDPS